MYDDIEEIRQMENKEPTVQVKAPHFTAGIILNYPRPNELPPIINYMRYWDLYRIKAYCQRKGWECNEV